MTNTMAVKRGRFYLFRLQIRTFTDTELKAGLRNSMLENGTPPVHS